MQRLGLVVADSVSVERGSVRIEGRHHEQVDTPFRAGLGVGDLDRIDARGLGRGDLPGVLVGGRDGQIHVAGRNAARGFGESSAPDAELSVRAGNTGGKQSGRDLSNPDEIREGDTLRIRHCRPEHRGQEFHPVAEPPGGNPPFSPGAAEIMVKECLRALNTVWV